MFEIVTAAPVFIVAYAFMFLLIVIAFRRNGK